MALTSLVEYVGILTYFSSQNIHLSFLYSPSIQSSVEFSLGLLGCRGLKRLKRRPRISSLVKGNKIKIPKKSVIHHGIKRKKPPIGVKRVFKIVSGVKSYS